MAVSTISAEIQKIQWRYVPESDLSAGAYGYWNVPNKDEIKNCRNVVSTALFLNHPSLASGLCLTGAASKGQNVVISFYTPIAISASNADFYIQVAYLP